VIIPQSPGSPSRQVTGARRLLEPHRVPDLPGVIAAADTRDEVEQLIREAIELHLAGMREDGEPIPEPSSVDATVVSVSAA